MEQGQDADEEDHAEVELANLPALPGSSHKTGPAGLKATTNKIVTEKWIYII